MRHSCGAFIDQTIRAKMMDWGRPLKRSTYGLLITRRL